jgi:flavin-dependent dehydrogenase
MDSEDFYAGEIVQAKIPRLYDGRVVLVGDAGYAAGPTGSGTSLALAGAYILTILTQGYMATSTNKTDY